MLSILRVWQKCNQEKKKGVGNWNKYIPLSVNAKQALATKKILHSFFQRFRAAQPEVTTKSFTEKRVMLHERDGNKILG